MAVAAGRAIGLRSYCCSFCAQDPYLFVVEEVEDCLTWVALVSTTCAGGGQGARARSGSDP